MYNLYLIYDLEITPSDKNIGVIKSRLDFDVLKNSAMKNNDAYSYFKQVVRKNCPELGDEEKKYIDFYYVDLNIDSYRVQCRFFEITNTMLLTSNISCDTIRTLMHHHFIHLHDISSSEKANKMFKYRLEKMIEKMETKEFYDLTSINIPIKTNLFNYQINNINWMISFENNPIKKRITHERLIHFPDKRIYNYTHNRFIDESEIKALQVKGGIIADEVGKGKTVQLLSLCFARNIPTIILMPKHLRFHWENEQAKHFIGEINARFVVFEEFNPNMLQGIQRLIIDEIHLLYSEEKYLDIYEKLCQTTVPNKWGLSATPFTGNASIHKITQYLTDTIFHLESFERFLYYSETFQSFFKRNISRNIEEELILPPLHYNNHFLEFNETERGIYLSEVTARSNANEMDLRQFCCDVLSRYGANETITEEEFNRIVLKDFEDKFLNEKNKLDVLKDKTEKIKEAMLSLKDLEELKNNLKHYEQLIKEQEKVCHDRETAFERLKSIMENQKECAICTMEIEGSYCITNCNHYFCENCFNQYKEICLRKEGRHICAMCRSIVQDYHTLGNSPEKAPYCSKMMKLLEIVRSSDSQLIVFTQFEKIIDKISFILAKEGFKSLTFSEDNIGKFKENQAKILILSSKDNACGLDLSFVSNIVIFEPIVGNFVSDVEKQIIGRIYRINQERECNVHRLIIKDTIEEKIYSEII